MWKSNKEVANGIEYHCELIDKCCAFVVICKNYIKIFNKIDILLDKKQ